MVLIFTCGDIYLNGKFNIQHPRYYGSLGLVTAVWGVYKSPLKLQNPEKPLKNKLSPWKAGTKMTTNESSIWKTYKTDLENLYLLVEHEATGNGITDFKELKLK